MPELSRLVRKSLVLAVAVVLAAGLAAARGQTAYQFATFNDPTAGGGTEISGISGNMIVGEFFDSQGSAIHGFAYNGSTFTTLNYPGSTKTFANGVSGNLVVGSYYDSAGVVHGFTYNGSTYEPFGDPLGVNGGAAIGVSGNTIVGTYIDSSNQTHGYMETGGNFTTLDVPATAGGQTVPDGISGSVVVGRYITGPAISGGSQYGFVDDGGSFVTLSDPLAEPIGIGGSVTQALGVSGQLVVGFYDDSSPNEHGFIYNGSDFMTLDDPLGLNTTITGISGTTIVGYYTSPTAGINGFIATPVPEPASSTIMCVGSAALLRLRRKTCRRA